MKYLFAFTVLCASGGAAAALVTFDPEPWAGARANVERTLEEVLRQPGSSPPLEPLFNELWFLNLRLAWRHPTEQAKILEYAVRGAVRAVLGRLGPVDPARARELTARFIDIGEQFSLEPGRALARVAEPINRSEAARRRRIYGGLGAIGLVLAGGTAIAHVPILPVLVAIPTMMMGMKMTGMFLPELDEVVVGPALRDCTALFTQLQMRAGDDRDEVIEQAERV